MFEKNALGKNARQMKIQYSSFVLKMIAAVMMLIGTIGVAIIQNGVMDLGNMSTAMLSQEFENYGSTFWLATASLFCRGIMSLALPIYAFLLIEGYKKTSDKKKYAIRMLLVALIAEIPYDLAMQDTWFTMYSQNPMWGIVLAFAVLYFLDSFEETKKFKGLLLKLVIIIAGVLWAVMLNVSYGVGMIMIVAILWLMEGNGALTTMGAVVASLIYFPAPFGFIFNHFYSGEKGKDNRMLFYVIYPVQLLILGLVGKYLIH